MDLTKPCPQGHTDRYPNGVCRPCNQARAQANWHKKSPRSRMAIALRDKHGLTLEDFDRMVITANGCCEICSKQLTGYNEPLVDHDHETEKIRGLLCLLCNMLLGKAKDSPARLRDAAHYLERTQ